MFKLINIGFGNMVLANRVIALVSNDSAPVKRIIQDAREKGLLIDATHGRRTRAVIVADSGHIILSAINPETIANRIYTKGSDSVSEVVGEESRSFHPYTNSSISEGLCPSEPPRKGTPPLDPLKETPQSGVSG